VVVRNAHQSNQILYAMFPVAETEGPVIAEVLQAKKSILDTPMSIQINWVTTRELACLCPESVEITQEVFDGGLFSIVVMFEYDPSLAEIMQ